MTHGKHRSALDTTVEQEGWPEQRDSIGWQKLSCVHSSRLIKVRPCVVLVFASLIDNAVYMKHSRPSPSASAMCIFILHIVYLGGFDKPLIHCSS